MQLNGSIVDSDGRDVSGKNFSSIVFGTKGRIEASRSKKNVTFYSDQKQCAAGRTPRPREFAATNIFARMKTNAAGKNQSYLFDRRKRKFLSFGISEYGKAYTDEERKIPYFCPLIERFSGL